ncbi:MAG: 3'(2'),5'-bisphosphate nucleotidase [Planctomycetales bacterium]|nr:3'(2'),5'-bisphosphate nucleotidase [Planctomycetales bacterium]
MPDRPELTFALSAVRAAAQLVAKVQAEMVSPALTKDDRSPVTVGDFAAQALVASRLQQAFPNDPLVGEEDAASLREAEGRDTLDQVLHFVGPLLNTSDAQAVCDAIDLGGRDTAERYWTLDPIDGTKGFLRGEQYAVCLALVENGVVQLGVLGCPQLATSGDPRDEARGALFFAQRGAGAFALPLDEPAATPVGLHASARTNPQETRLLRSVEAGHTHGGQIEELVSLLQISAEPVRLDSQAKGAVLAAGCGDALVRLLSPSRPNYREKIWDQAAGAILVEEAGGRVTDLDGKTLDFSLGRELTNNRGVLASNGHLHEALLAGIREIGA